jgi:hypothetical protein
MFLTDVGGFMTMDPLLVQAVITNFANKGKFMVGQVLDSSKALVEEAARPIQGFFEVIRAFIVPDGEPPHVFSEPARPSGHGSALSSPTGGPCGNDTDKQFNMDPLLPPGMSVASTKVGTTFPIGVVGDVLAKRPDNTAPVSKAHLKSIVRNMAHHFILLFGCLYMASSVEGERGQLPAVYMKRICRLLVEFFMVQGFSSKNVNTNALITKFTTRVHHHSPPPHPPRRPLISTLAHLHLHRSHLSHH